VLTKNKRAYYRAVENMINFSKKKNIILNIIKGNKEDETPNQFDIFEPNMFDISND
jgi:hypothetical protein